MPTLLSRFALPTPRWSALRPAGWARFQRLARLAALAPALVLAAGCGDDDDSTGTSDVEGIYVLTRINNESLPAFDVEAGVLQLEGGNYEVQLEVNGDIGGDQGSYRRSGNQITFRPEDNSGDYSGTLSSSNQVLTVNVEDVAFRFERVEEDD